MCYGIRVFGIIRYDIFDSDVISILEICLGPPGYGLGQR